MDRLNKYLAHAGLGSRRHCEDMITRGRVAIDGSVVRELGTRVAPGQTVTVDGKPIAAEEFVYWLVHKPPGYLCTNFDPARRPLAIDLLPHVPERVYTVGRLDEESEGLLLLTNDGDLAHRLMHPRYSVEKTYHVQVAGKPTQEDLDRLLKGVWLSDGHVKAQRVRRLKKTQGESVWLEIVLSEGKNREIRRMLAKLEHKVVRLRRVAIGPIQLDRLPRGKARRLRPNELARLQRASVHGPRNLPAPADTTPHRSESAKPRPPRPRPTDAKETGKPRPPRVRPTDAKETGKPRPPRPRPARAKPASARPRSRRP